MSRRAHRKPSTGCPDAGRRFAAARVARQGLDTPLCSLSDGQQRRAVSAHSGSSAAAPAMTIDSVLANTSAAGTRWPPAVEGSPAAPNNGGHDVRKPRQARYLYHGLRPFIRARRAQRAQSRHSRQLARLPSRRRQNQNRELHALRPTSFSTLRFAVDATTRKCP